MDEKTKNVLTKAVAALKQKSEPIETHDIQIHLKETGSTKLLTDEIQQTKTSLGGWMGQILQAIKEIKPPVSDVPANTLSEVSIKRPNWVSEVFSLKNVESKLDEISGAIKRQSDKPEKEINFPTDAKNPVAVRLSNGEKFIEQMTQFVQTATGSSIPKINSTVAATRNVIAVPVVNPDGSNIGGGSGGSGDASAANQLLGNASLSSIDTKTPSLGQALAASSTPVVLTAAQITTLTPPAAITGFATETTLGTRLSESDFDTKIGSLTESAPATDTASSGLNGRLQRIAQRITSLIALLPTALGQGTMSASFKVVVASDQTVIPVSDNSGTLTVDAPVGTPVFVRLSDGSAAITTLPVSLASVPSHAVTNAGTFVVQENGTQVQVDDAAFTPATSKIVMAGFEADESSTDSVDEGDGGAARMTLDRKQIVTLQPHTAGGLSTFMASGSDGSSILVATKQTIKASAGQLYGYYAYNPEAAVSFVHFYNTDTVTVGTTNPQMTIAIPAGSAANLTIPQGIIFDTAISTSATTTAGGNTAPATGVSLVAWYK